MGEETAISSGKESQEIAPANKVSFGPAWNLRVVDPVAGREGTGDRLAPAWTARPVVTGRTGIPADAAFLERREWSLVREIVEEFKTPFLVLSRRMARDAASFSAFLDAGENVRLALDKLNEGLQSAADVFAVGGMADLVRAYLFREVLPCFMLSRFARRAYHKPGGYAGDYLMMEMIYRNEPDGDGSIGKLIDAWCLDTPAARAVRGRRGFLKDLLVKLCGKRRENGADTRILNLACGTNRELFDFLAECSYTDRITAVGIDGDPRALEYTNRNVDTFDHDARVRLLADNVVQWAVRRHVRSSETYDVIYTSGLTDYLGDKVFAALIKQAFQRLSPGGTFVAGNFSCDNPNKTLMDEILDWRLLHRSAADLSRLFKGTGFGSNLEITSEENGINLFAVATKPLAQR